MRIQILSSSFWLVVAAISSITLASTAQAQATRTWVSGVGDDVNPCSRTAPCKTFAGAISKTATGGEISVLDPGGFGAVTVTKSITLSGDGTLASIVNAGTSGVVVSAACAAPCDVRLRNLSFFGAGSGVHAVNFLGAGSLSLENVTIEAETLNGVNIAANGNVNAVLRNVSIRGVATGVQVATTVGLARVLLDGVHIQQAAAGVSVDANAVVEVNRSSINHTTTGILSSVATSVVRLSDSTVSMNTTGLSTSSGGQIISYNNNRLRGNTTDGAPTSTIYQR
jgi:hypothetical protein